MTESNASLQFLPDLLLCIRDLEQKRAAVILPPATQPLTASDVITVFFQGLFNGAGAVLKPQGLLLTYGVSGKNTLS